jgi:tetratricopeptide (TPR) repeat protein
MSMQVDLSEAKLIELLQFKRETPNLDYKEIFDYSSKGKQARIRLVKDLLAMANTQDGGYIVLGVRDGDFEPIGLPLDYNLDQATLQDKISGYSNRPFNIHYTQHKIKNTISGEIKPRVRLYGLIFVEHSLEPIIVAKEGSVVLDDGKQETAFSSGDILIRRGTKSERANDQDINRMYENFHRIDKQRSFDEWRSQLSMIIQEITQQEILTTNAKSELEMKVGEWHNLPRPDFNTFIGRAAYISDITDSLLKSRAWIVSIDGVGGVGKTALAIKCAYEFWERRNFELIVWTSAKSTRLTLSGIDQIVPSLTSLENILDEIITVTFPEILSASIEKKKQEVKWILGNAKCLLVVDNLETVTDQEVMQFLRDIPEPSKALVTSRHRIGQGERVIRLEGFDSVEAIKFIRQEAEHAAATMLINSGTKELREIVESTGGIPLAIKWVVGQVALGRRVSEAIERIKVLGSAPLEFCFRETFDLLSDPAKLLLKSIPLFSNPVSSIEFVAVTELPIHQVEEGLVELVRVSMFNLDPSSTDLPRYYALPMTRYFAQSLSDRGSQSTMLKRLSRHYQNSEALGELKEQATELFQIVGASTERGQTAALFSQVAFGNYQRGRYDEAIKLFEQAVKLSPRLSFTYQTWATVEWQEGNYTRARELWQEAARLNPNNSLVWRSWGLMEKELGNSQKAIECLREAVRVNEKDKVAWNALGVELSKASKYRESERCLLKALYGEPKSETECHHNVVTYHSLATTLKRVNRLDEALHYCDLGLKLDPKNKRLLELQIKLGG